MKQLIKKFLPHILLFVLVSSIVATNYTPGTYLTGWDNLHPEFNFGMNIKRSVFAVWQEYQSLGLLGGMGHAADLPRQIFLWIASIFIPNSLLRYFYHFLMLTVGVFGVFKLAKDYVLKDAGGNENRKWAAFLGAVFYLLNLGTIQYFFVPFEPYSTFWGLLPWELYVLLQFLNKPSRKNLTLLFLVNLLAVPQAYVQTIFLVYLIIVSIFLLFHILKNRLDGLKTSLIVLLVIFAVNAFWLIPNIYFVKEKLSVNQNANQNLLATEKFFLMNKERGNIEDFLTLKEFYFDFFDHNLESNDFDRMMDVWRNHFDKLSTSIIVTVLSLSAWAGLFIKNKYRKELVVILFISCIGFLSNQVPFSLLNSILRDSSLINQLFRNPFTKLIVPAVLSLSLLFGIFLAFVFNKLSRKKIKIMVLVLITAAFGYSFYPVWKGEFIYKAMRVAIPDDYFELFEYFKKPENKDVRIANFPQSNIWGWMYHNWGLRGSGFIWYGIEQPILDRAFDVWSKESENYYWEMTQTLYSGNTENLEKILDKYNINRIIVDQSIFSYTEYQSLYFDKLSEMISLSKRINLDAELGNIKVYKITPNKNITQYIGIYNNIPSVKPGYDWNNYDRAYFDYGDYLESKDGAQIYYPFRSLFTGRSQTELEFIVEDAKDYIVFKTKIPKDLVGQKLIFPKPKDEEIMLIKDLVNYETTISYPAVYIDGELIPIDYEQEVIEIDLKYINEGNFEVRIPKISNFYGYTSLETNDLFDKQPVNCDDLNKGIFTQTTLDENGKKFLRFTSVNSNSCIRLHFPDLNHKLGYLVTVESRNIEGQSLFFQIVNHTSLHIDLETFFPKTKLWNSNYIIQPPMDQHGIGYSFHLNNISIGKQKTINDISKIEYSPIPYNFLTGIKIVDQGQSSLENYQIPNTKLQIDGVKHPNPSYYQITVNREQRTNNNNYIVLSQAFDKGWHAYAIKNSEFRIKNWLAKTFPFIFGTEIENHILVNNWENGWTLDMKSQDHENTRTIIVFYLPQLLQYAGFVILFGGVVWLIRRK